MKTLVHIAGGLALVFVCAVVAELPPSRAAVAWIQHRERPLLWTTGGLGVIGFTLMMGGILKLLMDQDQPLEHAGVEDVERSVRLAARPVAWRASSYRVWGRTGGRQGSEQFTLGQLKAAWRSGAVRRDRVWARRFVTALGALMFMIGLLGSFIVLGPGWVKVLLGGALLYALGRIGWGLWHT
ncbi:hypothetical protein [Nitrospira moscoviensis]|uniref:Transmembrane protein n=1 Tax=Nitrospira moscoviensis TaxID=42253 RepID=A0A0K2G9G3_NITMO|nr:hypothetical protein [Nitrospira moscoviensis]ALA57494.1 membrane protein of unknown function [Nitrospira moscoviensis]